MRKFTSAAVLSCGVSICSVTLLVAGAHEAWARDDTAYSFSIPAKPRLSALADFTATTGIQVVRPDAGAIRGVSRAVSGRYSAETALREILAGSNLGYHFTGPRTVAIEAPGVSAGYGGDVVTLDTISVTGGAQDIGRGGVSEINITRADIERRNATDVKGVFRGEAGVTVGSPLPMSQKVYVHGIEETNLAVSIDGARQNNKVFHHNATTMIDPNLLKAVRVDAGVAPADSGAGALGGAIAYVTKDASDFLSEDGFGGSLKSIFNFNGHVSTNNLTSYSRQGGVETLGSLTYGRGNEFRAGNGQEVLGTATNFLSGIGKAAYQGIEGHRFAISHEQMRDDAIRPFRANAAQIVDVRPTPLLRPYKLDRQNTVFTYTDASPEGWWDPKFVLAYTRSKVAVDQYSGATIDTYSYTSEGITDSLNGKLENKFALPIGNIVAGLDFYRDRAEYTDKGYRTAERASNFGAYAQARLRPWERTRLSFGLRGEHQHFEGVNGFRSSDQGLSGNVSGEHDLTSFLTAKAGYSHVWAGIPLSENYAQNPAWNYGAGPKSVTSNNYTAGLVAHYGSLELEGGVFRTRINNARVPLWAPDMALRAFNLQTQGFQAGGTYNWADGFVRVRFIRIDAEIDGRPADSYVGRYLTAPIGDVLTFQVVHTIAPWKLTVGGDVEIVFDNNTLFDPATGIGRLEGYQVLNAFIEHRFFYLPSLKMRGEIRNLFNATYTARGTYGLEFGNGLVRPLYESGRAFLASLRLDF
ncbi:TonB-dependent receptor domain-containing protein [Nitrobacter sp. TKz-YC01]|uniref:TonB-dependent receptor domain-containing protein n=1 Tax=Nitrobacter sp. TKz-YC01 TaxID=3398703 RepID=UPI003A102D78